MPFCYFAFLFLFIYLAYWTQPNYFMIHPCCFMYQWLLEEVTQRTWLPVDPWAWPGHAFCLPSKHWKLPLGTSFEIVMWCWDHLDGIRDWIPLSTWVCAQSCPTLCDPMDCSPPGSSVHGLFQARILGWLVICSFRGSSQPRARTHISCISCVGKWILYHCATWEAQIPFKSSV